ncbi:hypothetical protein [Nocardioides pelophilus]|nr:hypothetical protein [Nocardioides pelophilus]
MIVFLAVPVIFIVALCHRALHRRAPSNKPYVVHGGRSCPGES